MVQGSLVSTPQPDLVKVTDFWVQKEISTLYWDCDFSDCHGNCCSEGCWIREEEKTHLEPHLHAIADFLRVRPELPFWHEGPGQWEYAHEDKTSLDAETGLVHVKALNNLCIFQMLNGGCAIHAYCIAHKIPPETFKFNVCVIFPLEFKKVNDTWHILLYHEYYDACWDVCKCIRPEKLPPNRRNHRPHVIETMRDTIISRIGEQRYIALKQYMNQFVQTNVPKGAA